MARSYVARELLKMGGNPVYREGVVTDNGNVILDVRNLDLTDPLAMESQINLLPGVVDNGLFAARRVAKKSPPSVRWSAIAGDVPATVIEVPGSSSSTAQTRRRSVIVVPSAVMPRSVVSART